MDVRHGRPRAQAVIQAESGELRRIGDGAANNGRRATGKQGTFRDAYRERRVTPGYYEDLLSLPLPVSLSEQNLVPWYYAAALGKGRPGRPGTSLVLDCR